MKKLLRILNYMCLSGIVALSAVNKAEAFFPKPPMPWDVVIDIPGNAGKIVSEGEALVMQAKTIKSQFNTTIIDTINGQIKNAIGSVRSDGSKKKNPGKGIVTGNINGVELNASTSNEADYYKAYHTLFYTYPSPKNYKAADETNGQEGYQIIQAAYRNKSLEYRQDVIIDTYFTGLLTERYLLLVEKTLKRLEECQNNIEENKCTFFGLKMQKIPSVADATELDEKNNPGLLAQMKNAYIVSTVYDRLMRIVEDLTAAEAIYRASKQIELVQPVSGGESSAEKYVPRTYNFASRDVEEKVYAKSILSASKKAECLTSGGEGCPGYNKEPAELVNMDDAKIMKDIAPVVDELNKAREWHNQKIQMPKYKTKYRQYLIAKIIHERAKKALAKSEQCAMTFFNEHKNPAGSKYVWGSTVNNNDHESRQANSISRWLIQRYEQETLNKIIGADKDCEGYYEHCPEGYTQKLDEHCVVVDSDGKTVREREDLHPCVVGVITDDKNLVSDNSNDAKTLSEIDTNKKDTERARQQLSDEKNNYNDSDYLSTPEGSDDLNYGSRIAAETPWQIGREIVEKLVEDKDMVFKTAWNDQKSFQEEYLRQKYMNIEKIIKSTDSAVNSYRLAAQKAEITNYQAEDAEINNKLSEMISAIASCMSVPAARDKAEEEFCKNDTRTIRKCTVIGNVKTGIINGSKEVRTVVSEEGEDGEVSEVEVWVPEQKTWKQIASLSEKCDFESPTSVVANIKDNHTDKCTSSWDLSVGYLVRSYYNQYLGRCAATAKENSMGDENNKGLYYKAKEKGRVVAQDKLYDVIVTRITEAQRIKNIIQEHEDEMKALNEELEADKASMKQYNDKIDNAAKEKNAAQDALISAKGRVQSIEKEIALLTERQKQGKDSSKESCSTTYQIMELNYEKAEITEGEGKGWTCPDSCEGIKKKFEGAKVCEDKPKGRKYTLDMSERSLVQGNKTASSEKQTMEQVKFVVIPYANKFISDQEKIIKDSKAYRETLKEKIHNLENIIKEKTEAFAERYIEEAKRSQEIIEEKNAEFENFMKENYRMENSVKQVCVRKPPLIGKKHCVNKEYEQDNLATTVTKILGDDGSLEREVRTKIDTELVGDLRIVTRKLRQLGLPAEFVIDGTFGKYNISAGHYTAEAFAKEIKDMIVELATKKVVTGITESDGIIDKAISDALERLEATQKKLRVCEECVATEDEKENMSNQNYHKTTIIPEHDSLINDLKSIAARTTIDDLFGIPENIAEDNEYFVDLPARGINYLGREKYEKEVLAGEGDEGAGRDYVEPKEPFIHQPPLREVFYYSAQDYEDTPKKEDGLYMPAIPYLLNKKYPNTDKQWEYMPEVWRYLLARPNLRKDRKYQQTFVERSISEEKLDSILNNKHLSGADAKHYRTILARGSTYPCKLGGENYDIVGGGDGYAGEIKNSRFVYGGQLAVMETCQDINLYNQRPCNTYRLNGRNTICHMLSSHGYKENGDGKLYEDYAKVDPRKIQDMFAYYSELGTLLQPELKYRATQQMINEYLLSDEEDYRENDIYRQKAEHAAFTHNVFGSFLETVNAEHNARKSLEKITEEVRTSFESLCSLIHSQKDENDHYQILALEGEPIPDNCDDECMKQRNKKCAEKIFDNFAKSPEDKDYGSDGEYNDGAYNNVDCKASRTTYETIFCWLDEQKNEHLGKAKDGFEVQLSGHDDNDKNRVKEYLINIMKELTALQIDEKEIVFITSDIDVDVQEDSMSNLGAVYNRIYDKMKGVMDKKIDEAKIDRTIERQNDDLGIASMENQSQIVPYCPFYIHSNNRGL